MNCEDVVKLAREAGEHQWPLEPEFLERFAVLVAAAERERIASQWDTLHEQYMKDPLRRHMMLSYELVAGMIRGKL
jgi:hypothetical protein